MVRTKWSRFRRSLWPASSAEMKRSSAPSRNHCFGISAITFGDGTVCQNNGGRGRRCRCYGCRPPAGRGRCHGDSGEQDRHALAVRLHRPLARWARHGPEPRRQAEVTVWARNPAQAAPLRDAGLHVAADASAFAQADAVFLCLPDGATVESVLFGPFGLAAALRPALRSLTPAPSNISGRWPSMPGWRQRRSSSSTRRYRACRRAEAGR